MSAANDDVKIMTVASCSNVREEHRSHVVVSGSYGGRYNAYNAAKWGVRGVIMNDAGIGKDNAGIRGLDFLDQINLAAAAAVLFAVNITAVLPATPANLGVFQAACAAVLHTGWHVGIPAGVAYGVILQAVEVSTAVLMGMPALVKEGTSWREVRLRAMHAAPVKLPSRPARSGSRRGSSIKAEG